ncbi:MAG: hypothetical protein QOD87_665, partial [Pseudonocardiales bacterium]|nr:hypothetical protein [Pseudonocardiales bacterium]
VVVRVWAVGIYQPWLLIGVLSGGGAGLGGGDLPTVVAHWGPLGSCFAIDQWAYLTHTTHTPDRVTRTIIPRGV